MNMENNSTDFLNTMKLAKIKNKNIANVLTSIIKY